MKGKVGVITFYYDNLNLGGLLQSYAMVKILQNIGCNAEQICYDYSKVNNADKRLKLFMRMQLFIVVGGKKIWKKILFLCKKPIHSLSNKKIKRELMEQKQVFKEFERYIPHSDKVYDAENIELANEMYDIFICGSDQIWNPGLLMHRAYFLDFVKKEKRSIAYAVSMGRDKLTHIEENIFYKYIQKYKKIGVREEVMKELVDKQGEKSQVVLDPTLLISKEEWKEIANFSVVPDKRYVFCYFLGDTVWQRKKVSEFAESCNMQIIHLPYITNQYRSCDKYLKGEGRWDIGPREFIALIHSAEYIFTDSFHAMVFSFLFKKKFYVFDRNAESGAMSMNSRICDFVRMFQLENRHLRTRDAIINDSDIDYVKMQNFFEKKKKESINFLLEQL